MRSVCSPTGKELRRLVLLWRFDCFQFILGLTTSLRLGSSSNKIEEKINIVQEAQFVPFPMQWIILGYDPSNRNVNLNKVILNSTSTHYLHIDT